MFKRIACVALIAGSVAACSSTPSTTVTDAATCAMDLVAAGILNPASIITTAATDPACQGLGADLLKQLEGLATAKAAAARAARR